SNVKLENKLKNRQFKQQSTAKKQRKEQRKLRQAISDVSQKAPKPLEHYKTKPEDEEDEEFLESLPTDMMEEDDLEEIRAMAQKASFITRDLSSSAPVHAKKRKSDQPLEKYEKMPRKMQQSDEKELIHLLPIKDKSGLIPQSMEKPEEQTESLLNLNPEEQLKLRSQKLMEKKLRIAALGSAILADPTCNIKKLKELRAMLMETDSCVAVTVRKLVMVSLMEIFKDIVPSYRIRPLTEAEKAVKVKKETKQLREFEEGLVSQYKFYLENLEQTIRDWKQKKQKGSQAVSLSCYKGLAEVAIRCMCELLVALPHFNFHNNITVVVVSFMNEPVKKVSEMCCEAVRKLLKQDKLGQASLATVRVISGLVKSRNYKIKPAVLDTLLSLRIKEVEVKKDSEDLAPKQKFMNFKEKKKNLSRMQRKVSITFYTLFPSSCDLSHKESLHCILTAFHILSGQGDVLNIDPLKFYTHLYKTLLVLHAGASNTDMTIVLKCLDVMLTKRRKQVNLHRALAFLKRLATLALHVMPDSCVGILAANRTLIHTFPKCDILLDNDMQGSGVYLPELDEPEYCNPQNTCLWELHTLKRHYHPMVKKYASHLLAGAPSEGSGALSIDLSRRAPSQLFEDYSVKDMTFNPPVMGPPSKKKVTSLQS
uniref:Nucleolar complex protein 3 homolog n=1 Tax=Astyanax mexicanus TaxID=7994 RepID=W5KBY5_ASTMX